MAGRKTRKLGRKNMKKMQLLRTVVFVLCTTIATGALDAQEQGLINNAKTPHMKLKCVDFVDCQWTGGFWADIRM